MPTPSIVMTFDGEPYETVYCFQKDLVERRVTDDLYDTLLIGEHPHVITLGRGTHEENLLETQNIPVVEIERGGDVTYHGPGQLVGYPIFKLREEEQDLHQYLRRLEEVLIRVLKHYNLQGERKSGWTGVWVGEQKIASIGVAIRKWVTYHGFAFNVSTDLEYFNRINPCGLSSSVMTSLQTLLPDHPEANMEMVKELILQEFGTVFDRSFIDCFVEPKRKEYQLAIISEH
jgi:lipoyl(octanoyl) transferase